MKSAGLLLALAGSAAAAPTLAERQANLLVYAYAASTCQPSFD